MIIYPAIDLRGGRIVRLTEGKFDQEKTYGGDPLAVQAHGQPLDQPALGHHPAADQRDVHHRVSVILLRPRGRSGSRPRARASAFTNR